MDFGEDLLIKQELVKTLLGINPGVHIIDQLEESVKLKLYLDSRVVGTA